MEGSSLVPHHCAFRRPRRLVPKVGGSVNLRRCLPQARSRVSASTRDPPLCQWSVRFAVGLAAVGQTWIVLVSLGRSTGSYNQRRTARATYARNGPDVCSCSAKFRSFAPISGRSALATRRITTEDGSHALSRVLAKASGHASLSREDPPSPPVDTRARVPRYTCSNPTTQRVNACPDLGRVGRCKHLCSALLGRMSTRYAVSIALSERVLTCPVVRSCSQGCWPTLTSGERWVSCACKSARFSDAAPSPTGACSSLRFLDAPICAIDQVVAVHPPTLLSMILRGQKVHFLPPSGALLRGGGGAPPTTLILLRNQ